MRAFLRGWLESWRDTSDLRRAAGLGFFSAVMFLLVNWRGYHQDVVPLAFAPVSIVRHGSFTLDPFREYHDALPVDERWAWTESNGHLYNRKSIFVSILVAPWYVPPVIAGVPTKAYPFWISWGRIAAAGLTGLTISLVFLTLRRRGDVFSAAAFSLMLAFGTCVWTIIGQTLYDHEAILFVALAAYLLHDFPLSPGRAFAAALAAGASVVLRPVTLVLLFPLGLYLLLPGRLAGWRSYLAAVAGVLPLPLLMALTNALFFGHWYSTGYPPGEYRDNWRADWPAGFVGLMISPNSGLLIQSPFFLLAFVGAAQAWKRDTTVVDAGLLRAYTVCIVAYWALLAKWHDWQGGLTFSNRMISEGYPLWMPLVMEGWNRLRSHVWAVRLTAAAGIWSVLYELVNLSTFDRTAELNTEHLPWSLPDHFFWVHVENFGVPATLRAVAVHGVLFVACAGVLLVVLRPFVLLPMRDEGLRKQPG